MLRKCTEEEAKKYLDFAYSLAMDKTKCGYPIYYDGLTPKHVFEDAFLNTFSDNSAELLIFEVGGVVQGFIKYFYEVEDAYIQTVGFNINKNTKQAIKEFFEYIKDRFVGFDLYMSFPIENVDAVKYLKDAGYQCIEDNNNNICLFNSIEVEDPKDNDV